MCLICNYKQIYRLFRGYFSILNIIILKIACDMLKNL